MTNRPMREQWGWTEHAAFMDSLEAERLVLLGGPLKGYPKHRAMLVLNASDEETLRRRLLEDPWMKTGILHTIQFYQWDILLGKGVFETHNLLRTQTV
jgi:hypothetical protein